MKAKTTRSYFFSIATLVAVVCSLLFGLQIAVAQPTPHINYQGKLTDATGAAVTNGSYNMRFWLLQSEAQATTSAVWTESLTGSNQVTVTNGLFSVMLGSTSPLTSVDFNQPLYLGVEIGGTGAPAWDGEMSPRKPLGTVPAAFESYQLGGVASSSFLRSDTADTMAATTASTLLTITQSGTGDILNLFDGAEEVFTVTDNGYVGIGNTSVRLFTVSSTSNAGARFIDESNSVTLDTRAEDYQGFIGTVSSHDLRFITGNASRLTLDTAGRFGIGTTSPDALLAVGSSTISALPTGVRYNSAFIAGSLELDGAFYDSVNDSAGAAGMVLQSTSAGTEWVATSTLGINGTGDDLTDNSIEDLQDVASITNTYGDLFYWNGSAWADIATSALAINTDDLVEGSTNLFSQWLDISGGINYTGGKVGIGTSSPYATFAVVATGGQSQPIFSVASSSDSSYLTVTADGKVGIGSSSPSQLLSVAGLGYFSGTGTSTFTDNLAVYGNLKVGAASLYLNETSIENHSGDLALQPSGGSVVIGGAVANEALTVNGVLSLSSQDTVPATSAGYGKIYLGAVAPILLMHADGSDGSTTFTDSSNSVHTITANGNAQIDTAESQFGGSSAYFDGDGDYLSVPANEDFNMGTGDFTIDMWYRPTSKTDPYPRLLQLGTNWDGDEFAILDRHNSNSTKFAVAAHNYLAGATFLVSDTVVTNGQWYHIAVVRAGTTVYLFVDGVLEDTETGFNVAVNTGDKNLNIGGITLGNEAYLNGHIDELRIVKRAVWTGNFTPPTAAHSTDGDSGLYFVDDQGSTTNLLDGATALSGLSDVDITNAASGDLLSYNGATWATTSTSSLGLGTGYLEGLADVSSMTETYGDLFYWNGSAWADIATSTLNIALSDTTGTLGVSQGGTGVTSFGGTNTILYTSSADTLAWDTDFVFDGTNLGVGSTSPNVRLSVRGDSWLDSEVISFASSSASNLLLQYFTEATSTIKDNSTFAFTIATSSSVSPIFRIDTSGSYANTLVDGSFTVNNGAIAYNAATNQTTIENLALGNMQFADDAGVVTWTDMGVTTASATGTAMSYTAYLDANPLLTIFGRADGQGNVGSTSVGIGTTSPWARLSVTGTSDDPTKPLFTIASSTNDTIFHIAYDGTISMNNLGAGILGTDANGVVSVTTVGSSSLNVSNWQNGYVLQASTTATGGFDWVSTTTLGISSGASTLAGLSDVDTTGAANGDLLQYNGASWATTSTSSLGITSEDLTNNSIEDLQDVATITETYGDLFYWNGSAWADIATSSLGLGDGSFLGLDDTPGSFTTAAIPYVSGSSLAFDSTFVYDGTNLGLGTASPGAMLDIFGTSNALRLSYDGSNYSELSVNSSGLLSITSTGGTGSGYTLGSGAAEDTFMHFDGNALDFILGLDDTDDTFKLGLGSTVGASSTLEVTYSTTTITNRLYVSSSTATSTFANGIQLEGGCFRTAAGDCLGAAGDTVVVVAANDSSAVEKAFC
ncbi:LamG domain-containing protein [Candidatus Nomurabacteria bacterium]|nr:LamG domain-containing protein [Candidatus Nomurabacteria bacterium]